MRQTAKENLNIYLLLEFFQALFLSLSFLLLIFYHSDVMVLLHGLTFVPKGILIGSFILPATFLMGLSFPLLLNLSLDKSKVQLFYGMNTLGGALGIIFFGLITLAFFGYKAIALIVPILNLVCLALARMTPLSETTQEVHQKDSKPLPSFRVLVIAAISGFVIMSLEVLWLRQMDLILGDRAYLTSLVLFFIIALLGISSFTTHLLSKKIDSIQLLILGILGAMGTLSIFSFFFPEVFYVAREYPRHSWLQLSFLFVTFIMPLFFLGLIFPATLKFKKFPVTARNVSILLMINAMAGAAGSLLSSYYFITNHGLNSLYYLNLSLLIISLLCVLTAQPISFKLPFKLSLLMISWLVFSSIQFYTPKFNISKDDEILLTSESPLTHFSVLRRNGKIEMYSGNYRIAAPYKITNLEHAQIGLAFYPALHHSNPKKILSMGLGYGITVGAFLRLDPELVDSVEILPEVLDQAVLFSDSNGEFYLNSKHHPMIEDARFYLATTDRTYDLISANISSPYSTGGSFFLTQEYFKLVQSKLSSGGVYSQLIWGPHQTEIIHTFASVFEHVLLYPGYEDSDFIMLGSNQPFERKQENPSWLSFLPKYQTSSLSSPEEIGTLALEKFLAQKPQFLISDHRADILFAKNHYMGFLWTYR